MAKTYPDVNAEIAARVEAGRYQSREELLQDALNALDERDRIEDQLLKALRSGERIEVTPEYWKEARRLLLERHTKRV